MIAKMSLYTLFTGKKKMIPRGGAEAQRKTFLVTDHGAKLHHLDYPRLVSGCRVPEIFAGKRSRAETPSRMTQRISHT